MNVTNPYLYWSTEAIVADLDKTRNTNLSILCANVGGGLNIGGHIRNANVFNVGQVILYGKKRYDRRSAVGAEFYTHFKHVRETELEDLKQYIKDNNILVIGVDNFDNAKPINNYKWNYDRHTLLVMGEESDGIPPEIMELCEEFVYIKQFGVVRSLNVCVANGIILNDYMSKKEL